MPIQSAFFQTELIFHRFNGKVEPRDGFYKIHTPNLPSYYWGNLLYFLAPPKSGDGERWVQLFKQEFAEHPGVQHMTLAWDGPCDGQLNEEERTEFTKFIQQGFEADECLTLALDLEQAVAWGRPRNPRITTAEFRPLRSSEWDQAVKLALSIWPKRVGHPCSDKFVLGKMRNYQSMLEANLGWWMGAFIEGQLVGGLGLFFSSEVGRFQMVQMDEKFRNQGLTTALLIETIERVQQEKRTKKLVIVAEPDSIPAKIYQNVGFKFVEKNLGICRAPGAS
ncbi:MAG: hypothetical protein A2X86_14070 [Bdellovibrionales bacterium GWA2_49_15]|nr:MAG: hypothetical protein A2X86_14070 [Bdellovibrionales bacterium GWA2_49_15]